MRNYSKDEIKREKCIHCGSKNKLIIPIGINGKAYGIMIRCCNCGYISKHINPAYNIDPIINLEKCLPLKHMPMVCVKNSNCPHKHCKLYNVEKSIVKKLDDNGNKILDCTELVVNLDNK